MRAFLYAQKNGEMDRFLLLTGYKTESFAAIAGAFNRGKPLLYYVFCAATGIMLKKYVENIAIHLIFGGDCV